MVSSYSTLTLRSAISSFRFFVFFFFTKYVRCFMNSRPFDNVAFLPLGRSQNFQFGELSLSKAVSNRTAKLGDMPDWVHLWKNATQFAYDSIFVFRTCAAFTLGQW